MPAQQISPAAPVVPGGGAVSRRHAKLLHHLFEGNTNNGGGPGVGAPVKDLRIRRVVPPASSAPPLPDCSTDAPAPAAKPVPVPAVQIQAQARAQSTPPEPSAAAAAEDRERKPMLLLLPRSKLVRDPASFGYRRLLPFLNQMAAANNGSDNSDAPSEAKVAVPTKEVGGSDAVLAEESVDASQGGAAPVVEDPVEPLSAEAAAADRDMKDCSDTASQEPKVVAVEAAAADQATKDCSVDPKVVSADPAISTKPCIVTRCARSKFVHHPSSFSYKRMLPFLMENNDLSSQEEHDRCKIRRVSLEVEEQLAAGGNEEHKAAGVDSVVEEVPLVSDGNCAGQVQSPVAEVSQLDGGTAAEAQRVTQGQLLAPVADPASSDKGELTSDTTDVPAGGQCQLAVVSQDSPIERDAAETETAVQVRKDSESDDKSAPMEDSAEQPLAAKAGGDQEMKDPPCDSVKEQAKTVPGDLGSSKPCLPRCTRSRLVHQRNSFSYKRMLPFLMENEITSQQGDRAKLQTVPEEKQLSPHQSDVMPTGDHQLPAQKDSAEASYEAELERIVEEIASSPYENCLVKGAQLQHAGADVSPGGGTAEVQKVAAEVVLCSDKDELASVGDGVLAGAQGQVAVSEDLPKESNVTEAERMVVEEKATASDENSVPSDRDLQSAVSEVSPQEGDTEKEVTPKQVLASEGDEASGLASDKGESVVKDQLQRCQSSESACSDVSFGSPTNTVTLDNQADRQERQDSVASPDALLLGVRTICKPSDPCASGAPLSAEEGSGCLTQAESGLRKVLPFGSPSLQKQCLSPKKLSPVSGALSGMSCLKKRVLSPKKGILKRPTNGCKGICMCLDCSVFRLRADRAFEFSRKQMEEADDIIGNLLEEVSSLRTLAANSSGQQEQVQEACQRASQVEEVARERQRQMQAELNAHCKIPGPRVKFAQYVDEKMVASSPSMSGSSCRRQAPL